MSPPEINRAKAVCAVCPVRATCLEEALLSGEEWGIWGGYTSPERVRATELLGYIDVGSGGELVPADAETVMDAFHTDQLDDLVVL